MDYNKIEDSVLKKAMDTFKQSAVNFFGIDARIIATAADKGLLLLLFFVMLIYLIKNFQFFILH